MFNDICLKLVNNLTSMNIYGCVILENDTVCFADVIEQTLIVKKY